MTRTLWTAAIAIVAVGASLWLDMPVSRYVSSRQFGYSYDLYSMFRLGGFIPLWTVVAIAFGLIDSAKGWRASLSRGGWLFAAVVLSGGAAELLKIAVRRERPSLSSLDYVFRPWHDAPWSTSGLGWPSSHSAVAFAAVWVLSRLHPRATAVWLLIGVGCGASRLVGADHYVSDIVSGAVIAYLVVAVLWRWRVRAA